MEYFEAQNELREELHRLHADVCSALADPNRIFILYNLADGPKNVSELIKTLDLTQPSVSRNLKILKEKNMVVSERSGKSIYYRLKDDRVIDALDLLREVLQDNLSSQAALAQAARNLRNE
ncbi:MAG: winged helix-turn-helix transcriptional regulator [Anaerolineaceae bacterium]|nr:winged helix-turn-helix transcriptional regulator [Anaerolineaceae bacterium]